MAIRVNGRLRDERLALHLQERVCLLYSGRDARQQAEALGAKLIDERRAPDNRHGDGKPYVTKYLGAVVADPDSDDVLLVLPDMEGLTGDDVAREITGTDLHRFLPVVEER